MEAGGVEPHPFYGTDRLSGDDQNHLISASINDLRFKNNNNLSIKNNLSGKEEVVFGPNVGM